MRIYLYHLCRVISFAFLAGCSAVAATTVLAPTPNLYTSDTGDTYPVQNVPVGFRKTDSEILYVTDRNPEANSDGVVTGYGTERSDSMAFGATTLNYGALQNWDELVARTQDGRNRALTRLQPVTLNEITRFPATPLAFGIVEGQRQTLPEVEAPIGIRPVKCSGKFLSGCMKMT